MHDFATNVKWVLGSSFVLQEYPFPLSLFRNFRNDYKPKGIVPMAQSTFWSLSTSSVWFSGRPSALGYQESFMD